MLPPYSLPPDTKNSKSDLFRGQRLDEKHPIPILALVSNNTPPSQSSTEFNSCYAPVDQRKNIGSVHDYIWTGAGHSAAAGCLYLRVHLCSMVALVAEYPLLPLALQGRSL